MKCLPSAVRELVTSMPCAIWVVTASSVLEKMMPRPAGAASTAARSHRAYDGYMASTRRAQARRSDSGSCLA